MIPSISSLCHVTVLLPDRATQKLEYELHHDDPAGLICEKVAASLNECYPSRWWQPVVSSEVELSVRGVNLGLARPLPAADCSHVDVDARLFKDKPWQDIIHSWNSVGEGKGELATFVRQLAMSVRQLSKKELHGTGRSWGDTAEFAEFVMLMDEMVHSEANATEVPSMSQVGVLMATASDPSLALEIVSQELQKQKHKRCVQVLGGEVVDDHKVVVRAETEDTVSSCCEKVARQLPGWVDPSQVQLCNEGVSLRHLDYPRKGALQASISPDTWRDVVMQWCLDRPEAKPLADFIEALSRRSMPDTADLTWATAGEFGELVRSIDALLRTEQRRGASGCGSETGEWKEVFDVVKSGAFDARATPASLKSLMQDEFGR
mmetsp:Transcript_128633/g.274498  ORF Transcript_128633/g.274498 Transcript_128633/m.274498 type:complete len:377 (-) Transcript_128633:98-1228(-)